MALLPLAGSAIAATELQGPATVRPPAVDPAALPQPAAAPAAAPATAAGAQVSLSQVRLDGCRAISCEALLAALGPLPTQPVGFAQIEDLAQRVADHYKRAGYPFVQVVVPPQRISQGVVTLRVLEGVLGQATAQGPDPLVPGAQPFIDHGLPRGEPIREVALERTMLLLNDQPGFKVRPVLRPGAEVGQGDLAVAITRVSRVGGELGFDNTGNRSTGRHRLKGALQLNSPLRFGDRLALNLLTTDENMHLGSLDYETPLGANGWRALAGWSKTSYQLGGGFEALGAHGTASTASAKLSYPLIRSQAANLQVSAAWLHKTLRDHYDSVGLVKDKSSQQVLLAAQFDRRDALMGGGVSYGQISLAAGQLDMDAGSQALDASSAQTAGHFSKVNLDVARIQRLSGPFSAYGRVSAQWASGNLDSSEKYGLGGFLGVRSYPMGEATGDKGWLSQWELRWAQGNFTGFVFADVGQMKLNANPWDSASASSRSIAGTGVGVRWGDQGWNVESTLAGRMRGGPSTAESQASGLRWFVTLSRRFD